MREFKPKFIYHVTSRTPDQKWFEKPLSIVWGQCLNSLVSAYALHQVELIGFVLMQNHYHMILRANHGYLDKFIKKINKDLNVFDPKYKCSLIQSQKYLHNTYRYVYQNPLRSQLTPLCENYPYSTLFYLVRGREFVVPITDHFGFKDEFALRWLNSIMSESETELLRWQIKKSSIIRP